MQVACRSAVLQFLLLAAATPAGGGPIATALVEFAAPDGLPPLRLPTAVAVGSDGVVYVLDGVHDRILRFRPDGAVAGALTEFGAERLNQPVGLRSTPDDRLWIADSGNGRVLLVRPDGTPERQIAIPPVAGGHPVDPTDVAPMSDGSAIWIADNENHRLVRFDLKSETWQTVGRLGVALGRFEYPFAVALTPGGDVVVTDVINGRAQLFNPRGEPQQNIGRYGVEPGEFHRPGGLAVDAAGRIWIADSVLGVVQVFRADGNLIDVLRDPAGAPLRLEAPLGLAFDRAGALYIVESRAHRVRKFAITESDQPAAAAPGPLRRPPVAASHQAKACTICHIDWAPPFAAGRDSGLMPRPVAAPGNPVVARSEMCLSCHDGTVADSRRRVWEEHGHRTGVAPPTTMTVPSHLPLVDGQLACRTCHSAHGSAAPSGDFRRAVLLRVPNPASELCMSCHVDKTRGPRFGTHPTGGMPWPVPEALIAAGARVGPNPRELTCQVCHIPHGAKNDHLLVLGTSSNQLCVTCHDQMRPGMFRDGAHAEHPQMARVNAEQAAAVQALGTKLGPDNQLVCLSCHKLHHGFGERFLLADELAEGQMCLRCHAERQDMVGSAHDLRVNFAAERNRLGQTAAEGGPCSSCHLFHRYARRATPGPGDAAGHCLTCHQPGQCGQNKLLGSVNHPSLHCTECHNPHETRFADFLRAKPETLCTGCHVDQAHLVGGGHDATLRPGSWCAGGKHDGDRCLACHRPHGDEAHGLFRVAPAGGAKSGDGVCLGCHTDVAADGGKLAVLHPGAGPAHSGGMECRTCHDPHGGSSGAAHLLRAVRRDGADLCLGCHAAMAPILHTVHSPASLAEHAYPATACLPCHEVHGDRSAARPGHLWAAQLTPAAAPAGGTGVDAHDPYCLGCHRPGGGAAPPRCASHPDVPMFAAPGLSALSTLPLFNVRGERDPHGRIACRTCHLPHGRSVAAPEAGDAAADPHGQRLLLRPFHAPNTCTNCHDMDGLRRYLYFHDAARRGPQ